MSARRAEDRWINSGEDFIRGAWFWPLEGPASATAVVIVPGIAHEERTMNGGLVALAEALADAGLPTLMIDLHGCSQSAGRLEDTDIGARWQANIRAAVRHARESGATRVIVVGVRLGVPLAIEALAGEPLAALVAWAPIVSGKRYVRELKVLQRTTETGEAGSIAIGGFSLPPSVIECISALDLSRADPPNAPFVMLREMTESLNAPWLARLGEHGPIVQEQVSTQIQPWLFGCTDQPELPFEDIRALASWCHAVHQQQAEPGDPTPRRPEPRPVIEFRHHGRTIRETLVEIGLSGLTGVVSEPAESATGHAARLMVSTVGPGRTFADFARDEASRGNTTLRFDFSGFGTSGRGDAVQGGENYTANGKRDVRSAIRYLRQAGHRHIFGVGFCAGAWSMIHAAVGAEVSAAVTINVALYEQRNPRISKFAKALLPRGLARFSPALAGELLVRKIAARAQRKSHKRREPIDWLVKLCNSDTRVLLAFADCDPGLHYLKGQLNRGLHKQVRRPFRVQIYDGLGHLAEGPSARTRLFQDIADFFAELDREAHPDSCPSSRGTALDQAMVPALNSIKA